MTASSSGQPDTSYHHGQEASGEPRAANRRAWSRTVAVDLVGFAEVTAISIGGLLPAWIFSHFGGVDLNWTFVLQSSLVAAFVGYLCLRDSGMYDTSKLHDLPTSPGRLLAALSIAIFCIVGLGLPVAGLEEHMLIWYASWLFASLTLLIPLRAISARILARLTASGYFDRRIAVFGAGSIARKVHDHLAASQTGIRFVGVYDDRAGQERLDPEGLTVTGRLQDLLSAAQDEQIDDIIIALPAAADGRISSIVRTLERVPCSVHVVTHLASDLLEGQTAHRVSQIGSIGLLDVKERPLADWSPIVKRAEDIVVSAIGLVMALPVLMVAIAAIKLESRGPAFYVQRRRGLNRNVIDVLKLRTLTVTESDSEVRQVTSNDARLTKTGRFLRRMSIDELPQLWNVLRGDMSVVGPRPHALVHDDTYATMLEEYANRHQVKPGITGLAQVNGLRGQTETVDKMKARVDQDIAYIKDWSLWLDIKIIARTAVIVALGKNAH